MAVFLSFNFILIKALLKKSTMNIFDELQF